MKKRRFIGIVCTFFAALTLVLVPAPAHASDYDGVLPQKNVWFQATPSVLWLGDPASTTTLEVHIVGRKDVKRVWVTGLGSSELYGRKELFDDGTHGDKVSGDNIFTLAEVTLSCEIPDGVGYNLWWGYIRAELNNGTVLGSDYGNTVALVDPKYKNVFPVQDLGNGLSATPYAFFIQDSDHKVMDSYPVSNVYCGTKNFEAYKKLYSVFPDVFDFAFLMPGMQIFRPKDLYENVPYNVGVSNNVEHIGRTIMDDTKEFGSAGRLKSVVFSSFGDIHLISHELGHTWGMSIGKKLGFIKEEDINAELGHWNKMADMEGQMRTCITYGDKMGYFAYNGDGTWRLISSNAVEPYSPLELYLMGLIPSSEIPDVHILTNPDLSDPEHVTGSCKTITAEQIVASAGGERVPSFADTEKNFNMAFVVTSDLPYNDAAYAYFSLLSQKLMSRESPNSGIPYMAPFYWATGGRATLNTYLGDYGVLSLPYTEASQAPAPSVSEPLPVETLPPETSPVETLPPEPSHAEIPVTTLPASPADVVVTAPAVSPEKTAVPAQGTGGLSTPLLILIGALAAAMVVLLIVLISKGRSANRK